MIAAAVGRGYEGRHRLEAAVLGLPSVTVSAPRVPSGALPAAPSAPVAVAAGTRLTVVPVAHSADPLVDTVPHPIIKLFPLPVAEPASPASADEAVFADVDAAREQQATAELAAGAAAPSEYRGRHSA